MFSYLHQPKGFYKHLFLLALPVIVQNLITTSLGFLDTFMVGLLGSDQMSAVTVANVPVFIIQLVVFGLQSGSSVLISQYWGRGDRESINRVMGIGFMIAGGVSVLFAAILCAFPAQVLYLITDNLTLVELAEPYLRIVGFSYIFNSLSSIYIGMQRSIENPRFGMIVFAISMLCNTLGNYVLIFGKLGLPALGITGAAVATLLSRVVEFVVAFSYAFRCRTMPLIKHAILRPGMDMLRKFLRYSAPVLINETLWGTGFSMITVIMGHMANSSDLIAAYTLAGNIDKLMTSGVFGIAAAVSVIVGKEIGTGNLKGVYNIGRALCFTAFAFGIVLGLTEYTMFVTLMRPFVMPLFSLSAVAERLCSVMLMCYACAIPLHSFSTTMVVGVLRGGGDVNASLVVIDSIQTMRCMDLSSSAGTVSQVKESAARLLAVAKKQEIPMFIVGHVNKDGAIAGPKVMEHIVDTVLYFEGDKMLPYRILRAAKNRYGSTNELGMFDMTGQGLEEIENPSQMLLEGRPLGVSGNCVACTMEGSRPILSEIQALATKTNFPAPRRACSGYDYNRMNLLIAVLEKRAGYFFGNLDVYINIVGGIALRDTACDLAVCLCMVSSLLDCPVSDKLIAIGEVGLGGEVRSVPNLEQRLREAERIGFERAVVPKHSLAHLNPADYPGMKLIGAAYISDAIHALKSDRL